ncbi:vWA domain-containing protein [Brevibacillus thermoruber]|uniref:vWA domain-containing protein n=1 Tax=Brevibacillus thermoruber TaxID=33942 RepID=UPI000555B4C0|nr:VWA domain-containing protein [Brevibacillus thermoruber]
MNRQVKKGQMLFAILLACFISLSACSGEEQSTSTDSSETSLQNTDKEQTETADSNPAEETISKQTATSREEQIEALKALIPEGLTKLPETAEEFYNLPPGRFSGVSYGKQDEEIEKVLQQFPNIENPDPEIIKLYYLALLGLFAEDYPEPQEIINQIKLASFGSPEMDDPRFQFKEQYNVMIVLDASGSMGNMAGGKTRMEAAKEAIRSFAASLPAGARVGLRVYGHEGTGSEADKALSCSKSDVMYPLQAYDRQKLDSALAQFKPAGWTPIALALEQAQKDLQSYKGEQSTNIIYLVSDGIETCGGDPVKVAKQLADSDVTPIVNVVGFGADGEAQRQLKQVAEAAGGRYVLIQDQKELEKEFQQAEEIARKWRKWKDGASHEAFSANLSQAVEISVYGSTWQITAQRESYNFYSAFSNIRRLKILDKQTIGELEKMEKEQEKLATQRGKEIEAFLDELNDKTYRETIDAINKQYSKNVKAK